MIVEDSYTSISDIRDKTSSVIKSLNKVGTKIVLSKNKPVGIFLSIEKYNNLRKVAFLKEKTNDSDIKAYEESSHWMKWVEGFNFLNSLK